MYTADKTIIQSLKIKEQRRLLLLCSLGGMLEFYDFIIYVLVVEILIKKYFIFDNNFHSNLAALTSFASAYIARPLGGVIFGHIGDVYGRKFTFMLTILIMSFATFSIGLIPTSNSNNIIGASTIVMLRIIQGISIGGEIPSAITYISECIPNAKGKSLGIMFFWIANGITIGAALHWILVKFLSAQVFEDSGWRILFFIGGLFGFINFLLRKKIKESPFFSAIATRATFPLKYVLKKNKKLLLFGIIYVGIGATCITELYLLIPSYLQFITHKPPSDILLIITISCFASSIFILAVGYISDYLNKWLLMISCLLLVLILVIPIFNWWINGTAWCPMLFGALVFGCIWGVIPVVLSELFNTEIKLSGIALCYNLGFAFFGGISPLVSFYLIHLTLNIKTPAYYLIAITTITLIVSIYTFIKSR